MTTPRLYENFDLLIEKAEGSFRASVQQSPAGEGEAVFLPPYSEKELAEALGGLAVPPDRDLLSARPTTRLTAEQVGERLFEALLSGRVRHLWEASRAKVVEAEGQGLRLRLRFREDAPFESWPWELSYDPARRRFLAQSVRTPLVRYLNIPAAASVPAAEPPPPLRMLVVTSQPSGYAALDTEQEWERLRRALSGWVDRGWLVLKRLERATLEELQKSLQDPCHILHIVGHGRFDPDQREGALALEDEAGGARFVPGATLGAILAAQSELRLVVLNACEGALTSTVAPFSGVAQALVGCRIPAVIAMRSRISDPGALTFAEHFYEALGRNLPVDVAMAEARRAMFSRPDRLEWTAPVLYTRSPDCRLFRFPRPIRRRVLTAVAAILVVAGIGGLAREYRSHLNALAVLTNPSECPSPPGLSMAFVKIEPGTFLMGDRPGHDVTLKKPFCLGTFEVTQGQWRWIMKRSTRRSQPGDDLPASNMSWIEIQEFLARLNRLDSGAGYRLPTEAQWEYAARAGTDTRYSFGDYPSDLPKYANCQSRTGSDGFEKLAPVGSFLANPWGLHDMYGNVAEWVADWYAPLPDTPVIDPGGPASGTEKVRRGGSFKMSRDCGSDHRAGSKPERHNVDTGFRIVRDLKR